MRRLILIYIISLSTIFCDQVNIENILTVAQNAYVKYHPSNNRDNFAIRNIESIKEDDIPLFYIYHLEPKGFIIVSAEDKALPVLGYGFENNFRTENMPSNLNYLFNLYKTEILSLRKNNDIRPPSIQEEWNSYLNSDNPINESTRDVNPLIDAEFDQSGAWNNALTDFGFYGPAGCVAISMSQIMHYWGYPEQGSGSNYYDEDDYGILEVDFSTSFYDFDNMAATYATSASQLLIYHTGISVNMDYENSGSGAMTGGSYPSAEYAYENFFIYNQNINEKYRENYTSDTEFRNILKDQLDHYQPILYSGYEDSNYNGGHAWNIDGYQGNNLHCNWGWGGWSNGYFNLSSMGGFASHQGALVNILPEPYTSPLALFEIEVNEMTAIFVDLSEVVNETEIEYWNWNFGDGSSETNTNGFAQHTYSESGEYTVLLTVTNIYGYTSDPHIETVTIGEPILPGDVNFDEVVNILDVVLIINSILGSSTLTGSAYTAADLNGDGIVNVQDIVLLINTILD